MDKIGDHLEKSLSLQLLNPSLSTALGQIILVVLVKHETNEFSIKLSLRFSVLVPFGRSKAEHLAALSLEQVVKLAGSITEVIAIALRKWIEFMS
jgi:hypothetical protein